MRDIRVETRASFVRRMIETLRPDVRFARLEEVRIALGQALVMEAGADVRLSRLSATGGATWQRTLDALHRSIGKLHASSIPLATVQKVARSKSAAMLPANLERARTLVCAMAALDAQLARAGLVDIRAAGTLLAEAITRLPARETRRAVGAPGVVARGMVQWEGADLAWFRALDTALQASSFEDHGTNGHGARLELPVLDSRLDARLDLTSETGALEAARKASPLEIVFDALGQALDEPPDAAPFDSPLGDLRMTEQPPPSAFARIDLRRASDGDAASRAAGDAVRAALDGEVAEGTNDPADLPARAASLDAVVVAMTRPDASLAASLARTFAELGVVASFSLATGWGEEAASAGAGGVIGVALSALEVGAHGLDPTTVASLARSAYLDARTLSVPRPEMPEGDPDPAPLHRIARAIEETPPMRAASEGPDAPLEALLARVNRWNESRGARGSGGAGGRMSEGTNVQADLALAEKLGRLLLAPRTARTRAEQVLAARTLFTALGLERRIRRAVARPISSQLGLASEGSSSGDAPIARAELEARARDARGWERLTSALDAYEGSLHRLGIQHLPATGEVFRHELQRILEDLGRGAAAARAGTLRVLLLREVAGEPLDHLIILDACEGALPPAPLADPLVPDSLEADLAKGAPRMIPGPVKRAMDMAALAVAVAGAARTTMIHRAKDDDGALAPAPIFAWLERCGVLRTDWGSSPIAERPRSRHEKSLKYMHSASDRARAAFLPEASRRGRIERAREGYFVDPARGRSAIVGDLPPDRARRDLLAIESGGGDRPMGVTDLERWAACPFQGFTQVALRARKRRRMHELPDPLDHGTIVHEALAAAFDATRDEWSLRPRDAARIMERATAASEAVLTRQGPSSLRELDLVRARAGVAIVLHAAIDDERWDFLLAEQSFGEPSSVTNRSWPALAITAPDGERALLRGRIDRLDLAHGSSSELTTSALRIVDFKGSASGKSASALGETDLQLPLYAVAAFASLDPAPPHAHAAYIAYSTREKPRTEKSEENFHKAFVQTLATDDQGIPYVVRRALNILTNARSGNLVPTEGTACLRCDHDGACRKPRFLVPADDDSPATGESEAG